MGRKIRLLGEPAISAADGQSQPLRGHQAWALLARVVLARAPLDRRELAAEVFPETVDPLGSLRWCLASLRKALDVSECLNGDPLECNFGPDIEVDVLGIERDDFDVEQAGPLLGSMEPKCSPEFSTWLLVERQRVAGIIDARIRRETIRAMSVEDHERAMRLAGLGVRRSPYDEGAHILLVKSLALAGRHDAAIEQVEATEASFLAELGERPSAALRSAARRTIASQPGGIAPEAFVKSLMQSGLAALSAGAVDAGIDCLRRAVRDAEKIADAHLSATATFELGAALVYSIKGYDDEGSILLRQATELARRAGDAAIAAAGFRERGYVEARAGRRPTAATYLAQAEELAAGSDALAGVHAVIGFNLVDWGRVGEGLDHYGLSLEHARAAGNRRREIWSLGLGGWGLLAADRLPEADAWLADCLALIEEQQWISFRPWPVAVLSESRMRQQTRPSELRPMLEEAYALSCQMGDPCWEGAVARVLALTYADEGALPEAEAWLGEAIRRATRDIDIYTALHVEILASQAEISLRQGHLEEADAFGREWLALAARTHRDTHVKRAAAFIGRG